MASIQPPTIDAMRAARLCREVFAVEGEVTTLPSERDRNFRIRAADGTGWVLKVANAAEPASRIEAENAALLHLAERGRVPRLRAAVNGAHAVQVDGYWLRMIDFLDGVPLGSRRWQPPGLLEAAGECVGEVCAALAGFAHPALERRLDWDLARGPEVVQQALQSGQGLDPALRGQLERCLGRWRETVAPRLAELPRQVIHNDANDYNIIVLGERVLGLIDFGDMLVSHRANELAIAMAYAALGKEDPLAAALSLARGFLRRQPLLEVELELVFPLLCMRLAVSACMAARQCAERPDDAYLSISQAPLHAALPQLLALPPRLAWYRLRHAAGLPPVPTAAAVQAHLQSLRGRFAPLLGTGLPMSESLPLDLGVAGDLAAGDPRANRPDALGARIAVARTAAGARVAHGGWGEARHLYTASAFAAAPGGEARTVHLGIDVSAAPGTAIHAPLAGTVEAVQRAPGELDYGQLLILRHATPAGESFYSLYGHLDPDLHERLSAGQQVAAGDCIGRIGGSADNGGWWPHVHVQLVLDLLDAGGNVDGACRPSERAVWKALCPDPAVLIGAPPAKAPPPAAAPGLLARRRALIGGSVRLSHRSAPLQAVRGFAQYLYDAQGRRYLDAYNNVPHVGHCHPRVVEAVQRQLARLNTNTRYLQHELTGYAEALLAHFPSDLDCCFLVASGSEANELALRLARSVTGARDLLVQDHAYHGHTTTLIEISPYKHAGPGGEGCPPWVHVCEAPDTYRGRYRTRATAGARYADDVAATIARLGADRRRLSGFIAETCPSVGGQLIPPPGYLAGVYAAVRAAGGLCIADEVQTGFGRLGSHFWGFQAQDVVPDIVVLGKPIANGYPMGAVVCRREIAERFDNGMEFFSTFGGSSAACAAALATLQVVEDEQLQARAANVGVQILDGLHALQSRHALIGEVRGSGLFLGVELVRDRASQEPAADQAGFVVERMRERGVLCGTDGPLHNVIKLRGPMSLDADNADQLLEALDVALGWAAEA